MRKVTVHFHNDDVDTQEQAYLFGGNILLSIYGDTLYFRLVTVGLRQQTDFHVRDYKVLELPGSGVSVEKLDSISLVDYVRLAVN
ncbi:hypothetical protein [Bacillus seohaeanensis]|jgi:hypothetical protein|uniref:Uncharacterized protein n=1 Tax=Bacillus seohaeanensis TaxID=284580 RepID=A0ABW5RS02_9BACI